MTGWPRSLLVCYLALVVFVPVVFRLISGRWPRAQVFLVAPVMPLLILTSELWPDPWRVRFYHWLMPQNFKGLGRR